VTPGGYLADNTRTRWCRRRPWPLVGLPFFALSLVLVYAVPEPFRQGDALFWYALVIVLSVPGKRFSLSDQRFFLCLHSPWLGPCLEA